MKIEHLSTIYGLNCSQFRFSDEQGNTIGGVTVGIDPSVPSEAFIMGLHVKGSSSLLPILRQIRQRYPLVNRLEYYRNVEDGYVTTKLYNKGE